MNNQMNFRALGGMVFSFARTARMKWFIFPRLRQEYDARKMNPTSPGRWFLKPLFGFLQKRVLMRIFVKNSPRKEYLLSLYNAREQVISESKVLRKIFLDGTEVLIIYPERFGLRILGMNFILSYRPSLRAEKSRFGFKTGIFPTKKIGEKCIGLKAAISLE